MDILSSHSLFTRDFCCGIQNKWSKSETWDSNIIPSHSACCRVWWVCVRSPNETECAVFIHPYCFKMRCFLHRWPQANTTLYEDLTKGNRSKMRVAPSSILNFCKEEIQNKPVCCSLLWLPFLLSIFQLLTFFLHNFFNFL